LQRYDGLTTGTFTYICMCRAPPRDGEILTDVCADCDVIVCGGKAQAH
jgi:hypothetical protein